MRAAALAALLLVPMAAIGCGPQPADAGGDGARLEQAAIAAGVVRDPEATDLAGLYARETDRLCIVPGGVGYRIGVSVDYGGGQTCSARGTVARSGETLSIDLGGGCGFDARLDGETIVFPGSLPDGCQRSCSARASLTAVEADLQSNAVAEASQLRDPTGKALCGS